MIVASVAALLSLGVLAGCKPPPGADCDPAVYYDGADLSGSNQTGKQLAFCDLSGIDFTGADFTNADLENTQLARSNLTGIKTSGTDLHNAALSGARISDADLAGADVLLIYTEDAVGVPATLPPGWSTAGSYLFGPYANLTYSSLGGLWLPPAPNLTGAFLIGADLRGVLIVDAKLAGAYLTNTLMQRANLFNADLRNANFDGADVTLADLRGSNLTGSIGPGNGTGAAVNWQPGTTCSDGVVLDGSVTTCAGRGSGW